MCLSVPKFVTLCALLLATLTACNSSKDVTRVNTKTNVSAGLNTKAGAMLAASEMCAPAVTDSSGKTTVSSLRFQRNSVFIRRIRTMNTESQFPISGETRGTWGLVGEILFLTEDSKTVKHTFDTFERDLDKAACIRFTSVENSPEFCACEI
jgi:hypothetical protein